MIVLLSLSPEWSVYFLFTKALNSAKALANERFIAPIVLESKRSLMSPISYFSAAVSLLAAFPSPEEQLGQYNMNILSSRARMYSMKVCERTRAAESSRMVE